MSYTDSEPVTGSLTLQGLWIHEPSDPEGTVRQFLYGRAGRQAGIALSQVGAYYAGREQPVFDYGEHETDTLSVRIDVPESDTWRADIDALAAYARLRALVTVRDNRGRVVVGSLSGYAESDQDWGTQVSLQLTRADQTVTTVTVVT